MATCLYKPKPCATCKRVIQVGEECEYIPETKGVRHYGCEPAADLFDASNAEALAERLGYRRYTWDELYDRLGLGSEVQLLPGDSTGGSTGRVERETSGRDALWAMPAGDSEQDE